MEKINKLVSIYYYSEVSDEWKLDLKMRIHDSVSLQHFINKVSDMLSRKIDYYIEEE